MRYPHPSWIEIDLLQFRNNIATVRKKIGNALYCLPVKANAYGHGLAQMGKTAEAAGVDYLGVAHLQEGIHLRSAGVQIPILVFGAIHEDQISDLIHFNLEFTISSKQKATWVAQKTHQKVRVHLEVETGMQRTGVRPSTAKELFLYMKKFPCFEIVGIYSHLAMTHVPDHLVTQNQIAAFDRLLQEPPFVAQPLIRHIANSGAIAHSPPLLFDMVRPSLVTFGYGPDVAPCFSLKAKVAYFKVVEANQGISYGHTHITKRKTRIVTIPVGYGDGYRRALSHHGSVLIRGARFPIVGAICMDQFMVDVGDASVYVGDEVVLIGKQGSQEMKLTEIATLCDTIPYEILSQFNERIPRIYLP